MSWLVFVVVQLFLHPFHVSVTDIKFKEEKKSLQVSTRIFMDDLEEALKMEYQLEKYDILEKKDDPETKNWIKNYLLKNFKLSSDSKPLDLKFIGFEFESDVVWCYLEVEKIRKIKNLTVENSLLTSTYSDQENLVHLRAYEQVLSRRMNKKNTLEKFSIQKK